MNDVRTRGLLCSDSVALAIREGRQTQDRRPIPPGYVDDDYGWEYRADLGVAPLSYMTAPRHRGRPGVYFHGRHPDGSLLVCPVPAPCAPGDLLYIRECWAPVEWVDADGNDCRKVLYRADQPGPRAWRPDAGDRWRPSIHMPRWAARTWVRVTSVRAERVQDISEADARAEGYGPMPGGPRDWFRGLWDSLYEARGLGWEANPFVWVTEFERCEAPDE